MESVYDPACYLAHNHINIKEYFTKFKKNLDKSNIFAGNCSKSTKKDDDFSKAFDFLKINWTPEEKEYLTSCCSIKNLELADDFEPIDVKKKTFSKVVTLFKQFEGPGNLRTIQCRKKKTSECIRHRLHFFLELPPTIQKQSEMDLKPGEEIVITMSVLRPFKYIFADTSNKQQLKFYMDVTLLGSNTIADFRDMISCTADIIVSKEVSENPEFDKVYPSSKDVYPSGFIFIDGVFYNDFRKENAIDYSEVIRKWAAEKKIANFTTAEMVNTRFDDLSPRIGYPYVYQHKGCCEHIFIFSQMRLLNSDDTLCSKSYPYYSKIGRSKDRYCIICGVNTANWLVVNCDRLPQNQALLCNTCFKSYNYIDGKKIGSFQAYPYSNLGEAL